MTNNNHPDGSRREEPLWFNRRGRTWGLSWRTMRRAQLLSGLCRCRRALDPSSQIWTDHLLASWREKGGKLSAHVRLHQYKKTRDRLREFPLLKINNLIFVKASAPKGSGKTDIQCAQSGQRRAFPLLSSHVSRRGHMPPKASTSWPDCRDMKLRAKSGRMETFFLWCAAI